MIILAATPIGNLGDVSFRLKGILENATVIAAEDTRITSSLLRALEISNRPELISLNDHNEHAKANELVARSFTEDILVLSDAGMPTVSDPGHFLVSCAIENNADITVVPGPSAVLTALAISGLATDRFSFEGFLSRKASSRRSYLEDLKLEKRTMVFFEAPHRIVESLNDFVQVFGSDRKVALCRELTKKYEQVYRGSLLDVYEQVKHGVKGEICIVLSGANTVSLSASDALPQVIALYESGITLKQSVADVSSISGVSKRELYNLALLEVNKEIK